MEVSRVRVKGTLLQEPVYIFTDRKHIRHSIADFAICENDGHKIVLAFVPTSLHERQKAVFQPGKLLLVRGDLDKTRPVLTIRDARVMP